MSITSDIIVGFPGETEADFDESLSLLEIAQYDSIFSFKYSLRPNTPAMHRTDMVPEEEQGRRLAILQARQREIQTARNEALVGQTVEVLVERKPAPTVESHLSPDAGHRAPDTGQWAGRTSSNRMVNFASPRENLLGEYVQVRITRAGPNSLVGEAVI